jgi:poly(3-hydroxybutyrate) depolymerase
MSNRPTTVASSCAPGIVNSAVAGMFGFPETVVRAAADYFAAALARQATPMDLSLDLLTWWSTATRRESPQWATEHTIMTEWPIARLRDFSTASPREKIATLLLPPQAGHDSCIVDYDPQQSQIRTARDAGLTRVFSLDWIGATDATKDTSIEDYLAVIYEAVESLGGRVNLVGDCQGGWLAVIYAALHPDTVHTLTIAGAPIDFHAGEPLIHDWVKLISYGGRNLDFYRDLVRSNGGILPGEYQLAGFIAMQPDNELDRHMQLLAHIHEPAHVARYRTFQAWFHHTQPIAGAFYLWIVEHLFQNNELIAGTLEIGGNTVDLRRITCPLYLLAGAADHITPPPQVFALADYAGTDPAEIVQRQTNGGHLGLFMGHDALNTQWLPLFGEIAERSR